MSSRRTRWASDGGAPEASALQQAVGQLGLDIYAESLLQGLEMLCIPTPGADRVAIDRLSHLHQTGGSRRPFGGVEIAARLFPFKIAMLKHTPCRTFEVIDEILVMCIDHDAGREHLVPVLHDRFVTAIVAAEFGEIVGKRLASREQQREAGQTGVEGIATRIDEAGVRQRQMNQPDKDEVEWHLV